MCDLVHISMTARRASEREHSLIEMVRYFHAAPSRDDELVVELCDAFLEGLMASAQEKYQKVQPCCLNGEVSYTITQCESFWLG
jgi:hypothetical protein